MRKMNFEIGQTKVEIISDVTPEERKINLKNIYDTVNQIADNQRLAGNNVENWFYSKKELDDLKKNNSKNLIY